MINIEGFKNEQSLRTTIKRNLEKEYHHDTRSSIDFINKLLSDAYASDKAYDVSDMRNAVYSFAAQSTNQADYCLRLVSKMKFKSEEPAVALTNDEKPLVFYDCEVFPNLFLVNWKVQGEGKPIVRLINPRPQDIEELIKFRLVGFNCQEVYSLFTDGPQNLLVELNAGNIDLENNITYKVTCTASFDSGLTASAESEFDVGWTEQTYGINAEIGYDSDTYSCSIRAYCADEENKLIPGVTLAIYRRDYTGELIEIASELDNSSYTYVTDPHPALDYGRYRIVATEVSTGAVSYYDVPPYPIKETSIIIQWEEAWDNLVTEGLNERDIVMEPLWSGSLVKLPYNIDVSDKNGVDVSLVEYIGRKRPVSYYGTQLGETSSWKTEIPRWDIDTLYALRRLAVYTGDVYIREPSGTGYWANVAVSISQTHCEVKIPVSFDITRVEGGI